MIITNHTVENTLYLWHTVSFIGYIVSILRHIRLRDKSTLVCYCYSSPALTFLGISSDLFYHWLSRPLSCEAFFARLELNRLKRLVCHLRAVRTQTTVHMNTVHFISIPTAIPCLSC